MQLSARRYDDGSPVRITIGEGAIAAIQPLDRAAAAPLPWVAPGFIDAQVNGFGGAHFNDPELSAEKIGHVSRAMESCGVTGFCPTCITDGFDLLARSFCVLAAACDAVPDIAAGIPGFHLEGPYISPEDGPRGAHPRRHCRPPDWDEFRRLQEAAEGRIRIITLSPEYENAAKFIERAVAAGVIVAIGHTAADTEQIRAAADAGARFSTHLGNGAHGTIRRHPNYIWDQLAEDRLWASLIVDGHHLPPAVVKSLVRGKTPQRCLLVSDVTGMAGMPPGVYGGTGTGDVEMLDDGRLVVAGQRQYLAGATLPIGVGIPNLINFAGVDLKTAVEMAALRPAELLGLPSPRLDTGAPADLVLFDMPFHDGEAGPLAVRATLRGGLVVAGSVANV